MEKATHVANLIALSKADGEVHPHELIFIQSLALRMGVDGAEFQRIVKYPDLVPERISASADERLRQLSELIILAHIDLEKDTKELEMIKKMGQKLSFTDVQIDKLTNYLDAHPMPRDLDVLKSVIAG